MLQSHLPESIGLRPDAIEDLAVLSDDAISDANRALRTATAEDRIAWAADRFKFGLYALTSAGVDSALTIDHVSRSPVAIPIIHINTGFRPPETLEFRDTLRRQFKFLMFEFGPSESDIEDITRQKLWDTDPAEYTRLTKLVPLTHAIGELGVTALITGVRGDQTSNRAALGPVGRGNDGEVRIRPFIDWSKEQVDDYIDGRNLPRHPLWPTYGSVEDIQTMSPGVGREGRSFDECGIHLVDGRIVRRG